MGTRVARLPVWVWLAAIVVGSAIFRALIGRGIAAPFIMVDEVIWADLARGIADAGEPLLRGQSNPGYSVVYPLVISPAFLLFHALPHAYAAVKMWNAVLMSLAAIPAFFIARRVARDGLALLAALLAVAVPSLAYTGTVMTENVFYPLFLVVVLAFVLMLEEPTRPRSGLVIGLVVLAFATRVQAVAFVPALVLAPFLLALFERRRLARTVTRYRYLYLGLLGVGILAFAVQIVGGRSLQDLLGAYSPVGNASYGVGNVLRYLVWHAAELSLYVLVIPLAATIVLLGRARSLDGRVQAFLAATVALTVCFVPVVAAFASAFSGRIEERNLFYLAPLFVIGLLAWIEAGAPRPRVLAPLAALASALLVLLIPFDRFLTTSAITDTLMLLPFWSLEDRVGSSWIAPLAVLLTLALASAFVLVPRRYAIVLPLLVLGLWAAAFKPIWWGKHGFERFARGSLFQGIRNADRDWVDTALPSGAKAAFLWTGRTDRLTVNQNEFFNRSVGPVYYVTSPTPGGLPETRVTIDRANGAVTVPDGAGVRDRFLLADSSFEPDGTPLAQDKGWGVTLWRVNTPLVSATRVDGLYSNDTWSGKNVTYVRHRCRGGRLAVDLSSDANLFLRPQTVVARSNGKVIGHVRFEPDRHVVLTVPLRRPRGRADCRVVYTVTPTAIPSYVTHGENPDPRLLGAHFNRFLFRHSP